MVLRRTKGAWDARRCVKFRELLLQLPPDCHSDKASNLRILVQFSIRSSGEGGWDGGVCCLSVNRS